MRLDLGVRRLRLDLGVHRLRLERPMDRLLRLGSSRWRGAHAPAPVHPACPRCRRGRRFNKIVSRETAEARAH